MGTSKAIWRISARILATTFLVLLSSLILLSTIFGQTTGKTVRHHTVEEDPNAAQLTEAENDIGKDDYASAEPLLKKYLETYPESYAAWYDLGYVYHALGKNEDSIAAYKKSVAAKPDVFESNLNLGLALADSGDPQAEQYLRAATTLKPGSNTAQGHKRAWMALGQVIARSKPDDAVAAFREAATLDPKDPTPHLSAGSLLEQRGELSDAENEYQAALKVVPGSTDTLTALSNFYMRAKKFDDAQTVLRKLVALRPNDASGLFQLGRMLAIAGKNDEAASEMEAGLKLDPTDSKAQRDLADFYAGAGKYDDAARVYKQLSASNPNDANLHFGLGRIYLKEKKPADAEQELMKATQLKPQWGEAYGELAIAASENKDYVTAIKATDLRAQFLPENPMSFFLRATAYDHLRDAKDAAKYYHQFLEVAGGKYPDQEWQAQHRLIAIEPKK
ncbi:MAG TPA: tetratricopeptide repeat protein [Terriglobales bacterium]|nr:tetratricopeptide repeat protein [Terriglobales bacterium]